MKRLVTLASAILFGAALANPVGALEFPGFPGFPGLPGTGGTDGDSTTDQASILLQCTTVLVSEGTPTGNGSSCTSNSTEGSTSCSSSSSNGAAVSSVSVLSFTGFNASSNTPGALVDSLKAADDWDCVEALAFVATYANDPGACSGPADNGIGILFACTVEGDGSLLD